MRSTSYRTIVCNKSSYTMSSSNVDHHKAHKTVAGHTSGHGKQNSFDHSNAHSVLAKNHTKSDHTGNELKEIVSFV